MATDPFEVYIAREGVIEPFDNGEPMRAFQLTAQERGVRNKRHIQSVDKGLGKTRIYLTILMRLQLWPIVITTTKRGMKTYEREIAKWFPELLPHVIYVRGQSGAARRLLWEKSGVKLFICTNSTLLSDAGIKEIKGVATERVIPDKVWRSIKGAVADEFHRYLRTHKSKMFLVFKALIKNLSFQVFIPGSGSAMGKGPQDLWPVLHLCNPEFWSSYWKYVYMFCEVDDTGFGKKIVGTRNEEAWRKVVSPYLTHIDKKMVKGQLPPKLRLPLDVEMDSEQKRLYETLRDSAVVELDSGEFIFAQNTLVQQYKLRNLLICPRALDASLGYGAAIEAVVDEMEDAEIPAYVIYTPFKAPLPHFQDYLVNKRGAKHVTTLQGGISEDEQEARIKHWMRYGGPLLCTIKYAESFELVRTDSIPPYAFFIGHEWDYEDNAQAEDRLNRLTSTDPATYYYCRYAGSYDFELWEHIMEKRYNVLKMYNTPAQLKALLRGNG
jgi:hypothetical protein